MNDFKNRYPPQSGEDLLRLVNEQPLAWLVSGEGEGFRASLVPVRPWRIEEGRIIQLTAHMPRANDQVELLRDNSRAHLLFLGANGYISASTVRDRTWTSTWNFASAQFDVDVEFLDDRAGLRAVLEDLADGLEAGRENAWQVREMGPRYAELEKRIVGFIAHVRDVRERYKLGQDEHDELFHDIIAGMDENDDASLKAWMARFNPGRGERES